MRSMTRVIRDASARARPDSLREKQDRREDRGDYRHQHRAGGLNREAEFVVGDVHGCVSFNNVCVRVFESLVNLRASPLGAS